MVPHGGGSNNIGSPGGARWDSGSPGNSCSAISHRVIGCHCQTNITKPSPNLSPWRLQHLQTLCPSITYLLSGPDLAKGSSQAMLYIEVLVWWIFFETSQFQFHKFYFERSRKLSLTLYCLNYVNFTHICIASLLYIFIQSSFDFPHFRWQSLITFL